MRARTPVVGALLLVLVAGGALLWRPWADDAPADESEASGPPVSLGLEVSARVESIQRARSVDELVEAAGDTAEAAAWARRTWSAMQALDVREVALRYVRGADGELGEDGTLAAAVDVAWTPGPRSGLPSRETWSTQVALTIRPVGDDVAVEGATQDRGPLPLWLAGDLQVDRSGGVTTIAVDGGAPGLDVRRWARTAAREVRGLAGARQQLVVVVPPDAATAAALVGQEADAIAQVAGVTTTLDASEEAGGPTAVVVNPDAFAPMDDRAAQVVMTHEAVHVVTGAATSVAEPWVVEGFADWVALRDDTAPLAVSAGQALTAVRADGAPSALPSTEDFSSASHGLGATYELAWLVFRVLDERHDDAAIERFYRACLGGAGVDAALRSELGTTTERLTRDWRAFLTKAAGTR
ncbi:hypothetical protein [Aeromicrobium sp. IC_218]|uniref:hypothetical protein n=1 Tax=Aeromicrobium sp. IC_218 TaxID=2545468 RepID=UPI00103FD2BE|nr:hypothetical protein [Aeromicrobium sp. IC_218]TCI99736.1 hypothetical protein E0W78_04820 [Aeromicrobium sp. IC_218]